MILRIVFWAIRILRRHITSRLMGKAIPCGRDYSVEGYRGRANTGELFQEEGQHNLDKPLEPQSETAKTMGPQHGAAAPVGRMACAHLLGAGDGETVVKVGRFPDLGLPAPRESKSHSFLFCGKTKNLLSSQ